MPNEDHSAPKILAHRACLYGPDLVRENTNQALKQAVAAGFNVEFDIRFGPDDEQLVLAHDPQPWSEERDALQFLQTVTGPQFHALNVKCLASLSSILRSLEVTETQSNFLLFDFELVADDLSECRSLMRSVQEAGFSVAYRLSERETYLEEYLADPVVANVWLDEFEEHWVTKDHMTRLTERGIRTFYVSPDLHGMREMEMLKSRWEKLVMWGTWGICTDYPFALRQFLNKGN